YIRRASRHGCDKATAAPRDRLDQAWSAIVEGTAKRRNLHCDVGALDHPRPDGVQDLVLRDDIPIPVDQKAEDVEGAGTDRDRNQVAAVILARQQAAAPVEMEAAESEQVGP